MSSKAETKPAETEAPDSPLLDLNNAAVKKFIKKAKTRGYVTHDELNKVLPSDEVNSEQIEDVMSMLSEMGINVVDSEEEGEEATENKGELTKATGREVAKTSGSSRYDRTDDPVRMYLREMGTVELLSREGEIAIAKRIEAGRDAMIRGLCESPLTFEAMMVWRDELVNETVLLRDIIDLEATYGAENPPPPEPEEPEEEEEDETKNFNPDGTRKTDEQKRREREDEEEDEGAAMSMSAMEGELREGVTAKLDAMAADFAKFRKLQEKLISRRMEGKALTAKDQDAYNDLQNGIIDSLKTMHLNNARIEFARRTALCHQQAADGAGRPSDAAGRCARRPAQGFPRQLSRAGTRPRLVRRGPGIIKEMGTLRCS